MDDTDLREDQNGYADSVEDSAVWSEESSDTWSEGDEPAQPVTAPQDPMVNVMLVLALGLVVVILVATGGIFLYLRALNRAPRTTAEHDLTTYESAVKETPKDANAWIMLALAQTEQRDYDEALKTLNSGEKATGMKIFAVTRGDVLRSAKRYKKALEAYDAALAEIEEQKRQVESQRAKVGVRMKTEDLGFEEAYYGRGMCLLALDDPKGAVKAFEKSIENDPNDSTVHVALGDAYYKIGDTKRAAAAYKQALLFVPDMQSALDGLEKIEEGQSK